jgi:uncharacterized cupin superfamily protein
MVGERPSAGRGSLPVRHVDSREVSLRTLPVRRAREDMVVQVADVVTPEHGATIGAGFLTLTRGCFPWTLTYDEVEYVIEGELHLGTDDGSSSADPATSSTSRRGRTSPSARLRGCACCMSPTPPTGRRADVIVTEAALREQLRNPAMRARCRATRRDAVAGRAGPRRALAARAARGGLPGGPAVTTTPPGTGRGPSRSCSRGRRRPVSPAAGGPRQAGRAHPARCLPLRAEDAPRIRLRGGSTRCRHLRCCSRGRAGAGEAALATHLGSVAAYCRELLSAEYNERPAAPPELEGLDAEAALRGRPTTRRATFGIDHLVPARRPRSCSTG